MDCSVFFFFVPYVRALISVYTCSSETCCLSSSCELGLFLLHSHSLLLMIKTHRNKEANGWSSFVIIVEVKHVTCYMKINIWSRAGFLFSCCVLSHSAWALASFSTASTLQALSRCLFQNTVPQTGTCWKRASFGLFFSPPPNVTQINFLHPPPHSHETITGEEVSFSVDCATVFVKLFPGDARNWLFW